MAVIPSANSPVAGPSGGNISDVVGLILDKGLVIDAYVRVSLIGIEILTIDARVVVAGVDTYLRFAEAAGRLNLEASRKPGIPELISSGVGSRAPALEQAPDTALPAGATPHDDDVVALAAQREKERRP
jgi:hypothetical protein